MTSYDIVPEEIDRLHEQAEDLVDMARVATDPRYQAELRQDAKRLVRKAARLREQVGDFE